LQLSTNTETVEMQEYIRVIWKCNTCLTVL